jgi:hypothetical protein
MIEIAVPVISGLIAGGVAGVGTATLLWRRRGGRPVVPPRPLRSVDGLSVSQVAPFVDGLGVLTLEEWLDIGRVILADRDGLSSRVTAWVILEATIADRRLDVAAWYVRDAVETMAYLARRTAPLSRSERRLFMAAHGGAEEAALAVMAREHMAVLDFEALVAPFRRLVQES